MSSFPQFASLPLELQREIWQASLDEPSKPSVHIVRLEDLTNGDPGLVTIDIPYNPLMHVCRESRAMARRQLKFHDVDDKGACLGPYRPFNVETDSLYVSARDCGSFFTIESFESWTEPPENLRHLALDARVVESGGEGGRRLARYLGSLGGLQTLSIVFSEEGWVPRDHVPTGDLPYQLVDCEEGRSVWYAPPGRVKRQDMNPWEITEKFRRDFTSYFHGEYLRGHIPNWVYAPFNEAKAELLFDIIPRRIVPRKLPGRGSVKRDSLLSSIIGGLQGLMPSYSR